MTVRVWLAGRGSDLDTLAELFSSGDAVIDHDDGSYFLSSPSLDVLSGTEILDVATAILGRLNGLARVLHDNYRPVESDGRFVDSDGNNHTVIRVPTIEGTARVFAPKITGGTPQPRPPGAVDFAGLTSTNPDVAEAVAILGRHPLTWIDLYKVFEIIRDNVGNQKSLIDKGWKTRDEISAFTVSANSPRVSGEEARHARLTSGTPQHVMNLDEGRALITSLVTSWLTWLCTVS